MTDRAVLTKRLRAVNVNDEAKNKLIAIWPAGLKISTATDNQLVEIDNTIRTVEQEFGLSFEPFEPEPYADPILGEIPPPPALIDEGERVSDDDLAAIKVVLGSLDDANLGFVTQMAGWAQEAGHYIGFVNYPTRRRLEIAKALIHLSSMSVPDAFDLIATVTQADDHADVGEVVGTLTIGQAVLLQMSDTTNKGEME